MEEKECFLSIGPYNMETMTRSEAIPPIMAPVSNVNYCWTLWGLLQG
jgi:hypothetical protein